MAGTGGMGHFVRWRPGATTAGVFVIGLTFLWLGIFRWELVEENPLVYKLTLRIGRFAVRLIWILFAVFALSGALTSMWNSDYF